MYIDRPAQELRLNGKICRQIAWPVSVPRAALCPAAGVASSFANLNPYSNWQRHACPSPAPLDSDDLVNQGIYSKA